MCDWCAQLGRNVTFILSRERNFEAPREETSLNGKFYTDASHCVSRASLRQKAEQLSFVRAETGCVSVAKPKSIPAFPVDVGVELAIVESSREEEKEGPPRVRESDDDDDRPRDDDFPAVRSKFVARVKWRTIARKNHGVKRRRRCSRESRSRRGNSQSLDTVRV